MRIYPPVVIIRTTEGPLRRTLHPEPPASPDLEAPSRRRNPGGRHQHRLPGILRERTSIESVAAGATPNTAISSAGGRRGRSCGRAVPSRSRDVGPRTARAHPPDRRRAARSTTPPPLQSASSAMKAMRSGSRRVRTPDRIAARRRRGNPSPRAAPTRSRTPARRCRPGRPLPASAPAAGRRA